MDPVLQKFGDVTIQRLEKPKEPKVGSQNDSSSVEQTKTSKDENYSEESEEETQNPGLKRSILPSSDSSIKKFKFNSQALTIERKCEKTNLNNISEPEMSDYDSEFDMEESDEDMSTLNEELFKHSQDKELRDDSSNNASFFEKLVEQAEVPIIPETVSKAPEVSPDEDYDIDIKEKLKEMGEISFETVKKGEKPKKNEIVTENEVVVTPAKKPGVDGDEITGLPKGIALRRNIREVMDETKLDESTLAAQRQEVERLRRVQEQQRILRELQRQAAQERMQHKVISLLQGNQFSKPGTSNQTRIGNTVLVKLPNGQTKPMTRLPKRQFELLKVPKNTNMPPHAEMMRNRQNFLNARKTGMDMIPSVSIAPVSKKVMSPIPYPSDSDSEDDEDMRREEALGSLLDRPKAKTPVQTIDISSDDDCIVVSEPEGEDDEPEPEDPTNSGMHTNDEFNQPDHQGRVLINFGHADEEADIFIAPQISRVIKPHQIGGIRFLYDNVIESTTRFESSTGFGCILAHSMGLGKTLQIVTFSDIFLKHTSAKTILCIMPINTLQNWMAEFNMWLPTEEAAVNSPLNTHGEVRPRNFNLHVLNDSHKTLKARAKVIHEWRTKGGVLLIGYEQFRLLSLRKFPKSRKKNLADITKDDENTRILFDDVHLALVRPGPDLVICDEGHRIKNSHASISQALKQMETKRRVVLTGYPLQNNLMEYWCMVDFVRPNYLGSKTEFCNMFERPIMNGQCIDSTHADIKLMRYRAHVLHSLLLGFVQRRSHAVLQTALPQKEEYVLLVRMTPFQRTLYETFMNEVVRTQAVPNPLKAFAVCCKIWNHPDVLYNYLKKRTGGETVDIDLEEVAGTGGAKPTNEKPKKTPKPRKASAKGKNGKPAASVTPYNSSADQNPALTPTNNVLLPTFTTPTNSTFTNSVSFDSNSGSNQIQNFDQVPPKISGNIQRQQYYDQDFDQNAQFPSNYQNNASSYQNPFSQDRVSNIGNNLNNPDQNRANLDGQSNRTTSGYNSNISSDVTLTPLSINSRENSMTPLDSLNSSTPSSSKGGSGLGHLQSVQPNPDFMEIGAQNNQYLQNYNSQREYQDYQQNYWGQQQPQQQNMVFNQQQSNYYSQGHFNSNMSNNDVNSNWGIKKEEKSPMSDMIIPKSESSNDSKPKINIISDIKLPPVFNSSPEKKIKIISDIKIEPKKEELDDKIEVQFNEKQKLNSLEPKIDGEKSVEANVTKLNQLSPLKESKEDSGIPYDWAIELLRDYIPGCIENSAKMEILFCIIRESIALGDRLLLFSQSLITLDLIEQFLQMNLVPGDTVNWAKNASYYRLDGSTSALEREKLINEFNSNPKIHLFLVSTRAGSLGINLIGANRVVVLDASWNPCHDTQAVCRVYRYGQRKPCFVYRLVVDNCLEKKIYDRQINKQGMSDRVVDECNPDAHLTIKDVSTLCWDDKTDEGEEKDWSHVKDNYIDVVLQKVLEKHSKFLNKEPFQHESLLVDRKEKQLSQQEKRLAKKGYEREKQAARQPAYNMLGGSRGGHRPIASVRPMQQGERPSRWIPAEHWQRQGMTAQEMTLPLDVVIPTNQPEKGNIVLKAGQKVLVLKSPKGVYMQLESGKIVAIKTAIKVKGKAEDNSDPTKNLPKPPLLPPAIKNNPSLAITPQKRVLKPFTLGSTKFGVQGVKQPVPNLVSRIRSIQKKVNPPNNAKPFSSVGELAKTANKEGDAIPSSSDEEHKSVETPDDIQKRIAQLKKSISIQRVVSQPSVKPPVAVVENKVPAAVNSSDGPSSTLNRLEQSTSDLSNEDTPFQDTLDSITSAYQATKEDNLESCDDHSDSSLDQKQGEPSETSNHSDEVTYVSERPPIEPQFPESGNPVPPNRAPPFDPNSQTQPGTNPIKKESQDYANYGNYYNYPPYHTAPPPQGYYPPPHQPPPPYDMMAYPPQPQPQYNYGYQGYHPPPPPQQPHYPPPPPQPGFEYPAGPPAQPPVYAGYHNPYPQQYPPHPSPSAYPPPPVAPPYSEYQQYPPMGNAPPNYYPNT